MSTLRFVTKTFDELGTRELYELLAFRQAVFVVEQRSPYLDLDGEDFGTLHLMARDDDGRLLAYARVFMPTAARDYGKIGRVVIAKERRGGGLGREVMNQALALIERERPGAAVVVSAQSHLRAFYAGLGFVPISDEYDDGGIAHVDMRRG